MSRVVESEPRKPREEAAFVRHLNWLKPPWARVAVGLILLALVGAAWLVATSRRPNGSAFSTLAEAAQFVQGVKTMHITANMRTIEGDNFDSIKLDAPLVRVDIWREFGGLSRWRVEKPGRQIVMDGRFTTMLAPTGVAVAARYAGSADGMIGWLGPLLNVSKLFEHEQQLAREQGSRVAIAHGTGADGRPKTELTVIANAQGDFTESDYLKNKIVTASDNVRVYTFDSRSSRLECMRVYVRTGRGDVLIFETTGIDYNRPMPPSVFALEIPENVTWLKDPAELPAVRDTSQMAPEEVAPAFFAALAESDWDEARVFAGSIVDNAQLRDRFGGLRVITVGKPFHSGDYPGWFVPYKIRLKSGEIKQLNLAIRNDNSKGMWTVDGGY